VLKDLLLKDNGVTKEGSLLADQCRGIDKDEDDVVIGA
jgi:hypothetical protein